MQEITSAIQTAVKNLFDIEVNIELTRPDAQFGDYATNVALQLSKQLGKTPRDIAEQLKAKLLSLQGLSLQSIEIAGPGFLNFTLSDEALIKGLEIKTARTYSGLSVVTEYSDPNPFKMLHAGHIYTTVVGDAIANLVENAGGTVHRVNYGGDVGRHVAITMWSILRRLEGEHPEKLQVIPETERAVWLASAYVEGTNAFETNEAIKPEVVANNKRIYQIHADNDHESLFAQIYWTCRQWSYEAFDAFYARLGSGLEKYYPESEVVNTGLKLVKEHIGDVFVESNGAIVFKGDEYDLHTRVFINSEGIPTYETKEVGLIVHKKQDYNFDRSIVVVGNEQEQYMTVVLKAIEQFLPDLVAASTYVPHGMVRLSGNIKMSSRKGNVIPATQVLDITGQAIAETGRLVEDSTILGAVKYSFLKVRIGGNLVYEPKESVSLEGNSGPYLQYAHARARSILAKDQGSRIKDQPLQGTALQADERSLLRKITEYTEVVDKATAELMPHHICTYLYELAQKFNQFYEHNRVIGDNREAIRLQLVNYYADTLKNGLKLLGITAPDKM